MYRADVTNPVQPSTPSGRGQAIMAEATAGAVTAGLKGAAQAYSIFEDIKVGEVATGIREEVSKLEKEGQRLSAEGHQIKADIAKSIFEAGPQGDRNAIMAQFEERQRAYAAAAEQLPTKVAEMRQRSGALLKQYITKFPGLAEDFRRVSQNLTGMASLELDSLSTLYGEAKKISQMQADSAAQAAEQESKLREAAIAFMVEKGGYDPVNARVLATKAPITTLQTWAASIQEGVRSQTRLDEAVKAGGIEAAKYVNNSLLNIDSMVPLHLGGMMMELNEAGVGRIDASNPEKLQDPKVRAILEKGLGSLLAAYDQSEAAINKQLGVLSSQGADAKAIREAREQVTTRFAQLRKEATTDNVYLKALASSTGDGATLGKRMRELNSIRTAMGGDSTLNHPFWVTEMGTDAWKRLEASNRTYADNVARVRRAFQAAMDGVGDEDYQAILSGSKTIRAAADRVETMEPPATPVERAASGVHLEGAIQSLRRSAQGTVLTPTELNSSLQIVVEQAALTGANAARAREALPLIREAVSKLPKDQQAAAVKLATSRLENRLWSANADADLLKQAMEGLKARQDTVISFADDTGATPLKLRTITNRPNVTMQTRSGLVSQPQQSVVGEAASNITAAIDNKLLIVAALTGKDISQLRRETIEVLNKDGIPSQTRTSAVRDAVSATAAGGKSGAPLGKPEDRYTGKAGSAVVDAATQKQRDGEAARLVRDERTPEERLRYITMLEKALQEKLSPETRGFLERELQLYRGN